MPSSITLTVSHLPTSTSFFLSCLQPLNYVYRGRVNDTIGFGEPNSAPDFWITQSVPGVPPGPAHVAFPALSQAKVHEFFYAALRAGGKVHGEPALRDECGYFSAAVIDFDGNSIEAVFRPDLLEANKENIGDAKSVVSMTKSARSKAPTVVSSASKAKSVAASKVGSVAPSAAKSSVSKTPSQAPSAVPSKSPSAAPSQAARSVAPSAAPGSHVSKAPTAAPPASEAPARTTLSRAPTAPAAPLAPASGNHITDMINEAKGTISFAREMVDQARPLISGSGSTQTGSSPDSHGPSDAIVGTLLGVAAGAALHYAFSNRNKSEETASAPVTPPQQYGVARSESHPSWTEERYYYYHQQPQYALPAASQTGTQRPYAIEPAPSDFSRTSASRGGQKLITMVDNDVALSEIAPSTVRPRRRSSFSGMSAARSSASRAKSGVKVLNGPPPTSYRAPTAITVPTQPRSRAGSITSSSNHSHRSRRSSSRPADEGYASATEDKKSRISVRRSSVSGRSKASAAPTAIYSPLPPSRAATHANDDGQSFHTTHSKSHKTVIGRLTEKQLSKLEDGGRLTKGSEDVTKSVIGKIKAVDHMDLSSKEVRPEDSVSQVSSSRGSRRSHR